MIDITVLIVCYNQEKYIGEAIQSVLNQDFSGNIEIIIGNDASTDNTTSIVDDFAKSDKRIKHFNHPTNLGRRGSNNFIFCLSKSKGKYIAMLEGDDVWTDSNKLQHQFNFLEQNSSVYGCFHNSITIDSESNQLSEKYFDNCKTEYSYDRARCLFELKSSYATCALMFRTKVISTIPQWFVRSSSDYCLDLLITGYGSLVYLDRTMSAYRLHDAGIWTGNTYHQNMTEQLFRNTILLSDNSMKQEFGKFLKSENRKIFHSLCSHYIKHRALRTLVRFLIKHYKIKFRHANIN